MGKKGGDLTKTERVLEMYNHLMKGRGISNKWYVNEFGTSPKTMGRDLLELEDMGIALEEQTLPNGSKRFIASAGTRGIMVPHSIEDVMALFLGRSMFDFLEGTRLEKSFNDVYESIERMLKGKRDLDNATKLSKKLYLVHEGPKKFSPKVARELDKVIMALRNEQALEVEYVNFSGSQAEVTLHPYTLTAYKRGLYIVAAVPEWGGRVFRFALERFSEIRLTGEPFNYPSDWDPKKFFESALFLHTGDPVKITLLFNKASRSLLEIRSYHPSQKITYKKSGQIQMTLNVPISYELINWLLSFGSHVKVVSPKKLQEEIMTELKKTLEVYS